MAARTAEGMATTFPFHRGTRLASCSLRHPYPHFCQPRHLGCSSKQKKPSENAPLETGWGQEKVSAGYREECV